MTGFDQLWFWSDPAIADALGWYRAVANNRRPAKFRIARTLPVEVSLEKAPEEALWEELERLTPVFLACFRGIRDDGEELGAPAPGAIQIY